MNEFHTRQEPLEDIHYQKEDWLNVCRNHGCYTVKTCILAMIPGKRRKGAVY